MLPDTRYRSTGTEIMDDFDMEGAELEDALDKIAWINRLLGGNKLTIDAVRKIAAAQPQQTLIRITDLGCGNGDMLRALAAIGQQENLDLRLHGVDANAFTVQHAEKLSEAYASVSYTCADLLDPGFVLEECDIVLLTLTLHHFTEEQILQLLSIAAKSARLAIIINDLQRSRLSYRLFGWISRLLRLGHMNRYDGKLSILRGFKRKELEALAYKMNFKNYTIRWKWAFRYRWIIHTI